jgi:hypothetical protein
MMHCKYAIILLLLQWQSRMSICFVVKTIFDILLPHRNDRFDLDERYCLQSIHRSKPQQQQQQANYDGDSDADDSDSVVDGLVEMRRLLEDAWDVPMMGRVPTTPNNAVDECVDAMRRLLAERQQSETNTTTTTTTYNNNNIYFIDILLPQYDITYGSKIYDEILMAEFCIQFVNRLQIQSVIIFKDDGIVNTVTQILNLRDNRNNIRRDESNCLVSTITKKTLSDKSAFKVEYDDFEGINVDSVDTNDSIMNDTDQSIADFRESLMKSWDTSTKLTALGDDNIPEEERLIDSEVQTNSDIIFDIESVEKTKFEPRQYHRIASLFGSSIISKGADMIEDVMAAIKTNQGLPTNSEQMMIIVSAVSNEEMYAVRAIANKYNSSSNKTILFINCKLQPTPQELIRGQTIYSILPFIAQIKGSGHGIGGSTVSNTNASNTSTSQRSNPIVPKVVVLRRYPYNWEIFVNLGHGFDIVTSVSNDNEIISNRYNSNEQQQRGPSMKWIQSIVQQYIQQHQ